MQSIASILSLGFLIALIVAIVFGVKWYKSRKDKSGENYKKNKKRMIITLVVMIVCLIGGSLAQNAADEQEAEAEAAAQYAKDKKNYKEDKKFFIGQYGLVGAAAEELSNKESNEWADAIDNSGDDFDVDSTVDNIEKKHSDDIDNLEYTLDHMHEKDQSIQKNTAAPKSEKKTIHEAYLSLKHFVNHATYISGSYDDFTDEASKLDRETADKAEELQDL